MQGALLDVFFKSLQLPRGCLSDLSCSEGWVLAPAGVLATLGSQPSKLLETQLREAGTHRHPGDLPPPGPRVGAPVPGCWPEGKCFPLSVPNPWGGVSIRQGFAATLGWRPTGWGVPRLHRIKLSISNPPLPQNRNPSPWLPWKWIPFPLLSNQSPVWRVQNPPGLGQAALSGESSALSPMRSFLSRRRGSWDLPGVTQLVRAGTGVPPRSMSPNHGRAGL